MYLGFCSWAQSELKEIWLSHIPISSLLVAKDLELNVNLWGLAPYVWPIPWRSLPHFHAHLCWYTYLDDYIISMSTMKAETQSGFRCVSSIHHKVCHIITIQATDSLNELTNDKITMPIQTFSSCWLVSLDTIPSIPALDLGQKSFGNLSSLVPTEKMISLNKSWGLKNQTWLLNSQQRFSQCAITFFPFGKLAICYCPSRRSAMERNGQGPGRGPWWIAGYRINWQFMSPSSEWPHQAGFELVTSSPGAGIPLLCGKLMESRACSCLPTHAQALLARVPGSLSFLKASNLPFKLMLAFNCHKGDLPKGFFQIEMKRKRLRWTQLFVSVLIF